MVEQAIGTFLTNLSISIATVIGVLCIFMGWRAGAVVGSVLLLTVGGTPLPSWRSPISRSSVFRLGP